MTEQAGPEREGPQRGGPGQPDTGAQGSSRPAQGTTARVPPVDSAAPWVRRFRAVRVSLPDHADDRPERTLYLSNPTGVFELYAWDRATGTTRQVTDRPEGTASGALPPDGESIWWFDDTDGDEFGVWRRQPWEGGPDEAAAPGLEPSYPAGLALGRDGVAVVGRATDDGSSVHLVRPGAEPVLLYASAEDAGVGDLSRDSRLVCVSHSERGDSRHPALRVVGLDGATVGELDDGPGLGLDAAGFSPVPGDPRLLVVHERRGCPELLVWDPVAGTETELHLPVEGDLDGDWWPDASALLVSVDAGTRSTLWRHDLATGETTPLATPPGSVGSAVVRPDGTVEFSHSSAATPGVVRDLSGAVVLRPPGAQPPGSVPVEDVAVPGPGGEVHALVAVPGGPGPYATVFILHGGPTHHDTDSFAADRAAYVDAGYAVVQVNYRGSTGYGTAWRDALEGRPGLTELEDVAAVRDALVARDTVDPARCAVTGGSWGGYLTLLALGTQPDAWAVGVAAVPVADYLAAYADEMEPLRAFDRSLFGGSPEEVPDVWRAASPLTYVDAVRAPVLVLAGANDPRCPLRQIENYLAALAERGHPHEVYRFDAGHGSLVVDERVRQMAVELDFVQRHLPPLRERAS
jgi:dienelactone hydrolase